MWGEVWVEFFEDFVSGPFDIHLEIFQYAGGDAFAFSEQAEEDVFCSDVGVGEGFGFFSSEGEDLFDPWGVGDVADHFRLWSGTDLFFDFGSNGFEVEPHLLEHVHGDALAEFDEA